MRKLTLIALFLFIMGGCGRSDETPTPLPSEGPMPKASSKRDKLIGLARQIQASQDRGADWTELVSEFQKNVPMPNVKELFESDYSAEHIVDYALGWKNEQPKLSRKELLTLVRKICKAEGSTAEMDLMVQSFKANCKHPAKSDLIFYPHLHFGENVKELTPEEIVEKAITGK